MTLATLDSKVALQLRGAASDNGHISGWTHNFYRYPARFSPKFAYAAITALSRPGDLILDPYMGGGTAIVEALVAGRRVVGVDLNSLAVFVARVKTTPLTPLEVRAVLGWAEKTPRFLSYRAPQIEMAACMHPEKLKNMNLPRARFIKKAVGAALVSIAALPTSESQAFARCIVLRTAQWALDGRRKQTALFDFRNRLVDLAHEMLRQITAFGAIDPTFRDSNACSVVHGNAADVHKLSIFSKSRRKVSLVVTSPPYPGVHVLYHRWQIDGRRESPAPYWIINGEDGETASYYTFGDRRQSTSEPYFVNSLRTLRSIRKVMKDGGFMVQLVAFSDPALQLSRYLSNMAAAGFEEVVLDSSDGVGIDDRIWRDVPNRKWHAASQGRTHSSREVVLVHRAV